MDGSVFEIDTATLADAGMWCAMVHPATGAPLSCGGAPVRVRVLGTDGLRFRALRRAFAARNAERLMAAGGGEAGEGEKRAALELELEAELAAAATLGWENLRRPDGEAYPFSTENARRLYLDRSWILDQVSGFIAERANFLTASGQG